MPDTLEPGGSDRYPSDMERRVIALQHIAQTTVATLERLERRFDAIDGRFEAIDRRFEAIDRRIHVLTADHRSDFRWLLGIMLGGFGAMLGVMAHGFHWL
jgi:hypothetical protein